MNLPATPFVVGRPLRPEETLFGRDEAIAFIHDRLKRNESANLVGERRMGKTSIIHHLIGNPRHRPPDADLILVEVDLQANIDSADGFYLRAMQALVDDPRAATTSPPRPRADYAAFERLLLHLHRHGLRPALLVDEFETLLEPHHAAGFPFPDFFNGLRALIGANRLAMVIASRLTITEHFQQHPSAMTSTFPTYFPPYTLGDLDEAAADALLLQGQAVGISLNEIQQAKRWAGQHPCRLQCAGQAWFEAKTGHHDALWAKARFEELAGQACLLRKLPVPIGLQLKRCGGWLGRGLVWASVGLPRAIGSLPARLGARFSKIGEWIFGMSLILLVVAALKGGINPSTLIQKLQELKTWLGL